MFIVPNEKASREELAYRARPPMAATLLLF